MVDRTGLRGRFDLYLNWDKIYKKKKKKKNAEFRPQFGYCEVGAETSYQCTTRAESCVVDSATVDDSAPFKWMSLDIVLRVLLIQ